MCRWSMVFSLCVIIKFRKEGGKGIFVYFARAFFLCVFAYCVLNRYWTTSYVIVFIHLCKEIFSEFKWISDCGSLSQERGHMERAESKASTYEFSCIALVSSEFGHFVTFMHHHHNMILYPLKHCFCLEMMGWDL